MLDLPPDGGDRRQIITAIRQLIQGRNNATGSVTLTSGVTTTTVSNVRINSNGAIFLTPRTANAAAEQGAGGLYVSSIDAGSFELTHANNGQTDRTFDYICLGG